MSGVGEGGQQRVQDLIDDGVLVVGDGYRAKRVELADEGLPFARAANIDGGFHFDGAELLGHEGIERAGHKLSVPGDVVFTSKGTVGRFALVRDETPPFAYSPQLCFWRSTDPDTLDPGYLFYWMQSDAFLHQVHAVKGQTDMADYVSLRDQRRMRVDVPPAEDQREIAAVLGALDARIDVNRRMNRTLEATAQALFQERFAAPLAAGGAVPDGWRVGSLGDVAVSVRESVHPDAVDPDTPYFGLADMPEGSVALTDWGTASDVSSGKRAFGRGDILFGKLRPYFKKVGVAPVDGICSSDMLVVRPARPEWYGYVLGLLTHDPFIDFCSAVATGTRMPRVKWSAMSGYPLVLPPAETAAGYNQAVQPLVDRILANTFQSQALAEARDALLPELVSGRLRVPGRGGAVEAV